MGFGPLPPAPGTKKKKLDWRECDVGRHAVRQAIHVAAHTAVAPSTLPEKKVYTANDALPPCHITVEGDGPRHKSPWVSEAREKQL